MADQRKQSKKTKRGARGAVAVESALASLFLITLVFGVLEFGLMISQSLALSSSTRAGARVAAAASTANDADYQVLQAVKNAAGFMSLDDVRYVVVFKDTDANKSLIRDKCKTGTSVAGVCNVYTKEDFDKTAQSLYDTGKTGYWASSGRVQFTDYVGVYMTVNHRWLTQLFSSGTRSVSDDTVMLVQPQVSKAWMPSTTTTSTTSTTMPTTTTVKPTTTTAKPATTTTTMATTTTKYVTEVTGGNGYGVGSGSGTGSGYECTSTYCPPCPSGPGTCSGYGNVTTTTARPTTTTTTIKPTTTTAKPTTTTTTRYVPSF